MGPSFVWHVWREEYGREGEIGTVCGETRTRMAAWACALAALKGLLRLEHAREH